MVLGSSRMRRGQGASLGPLAARVAEFPEYASELSCYSLVGGVDEAGRGSLAGPVMAGAVILSRSAADLLLDAGLDDSKCLTAARREALFVMICDLATAFAVGEADREEIDRLNIRQAALLAMRRAVVRLQPSPDYLLVDGRDLPGGLPCLARSEVGGDRRSALIAAASVLAKVTRDRRMLALSERFPGYGWERNQGYPTQGHRQALLDLGVCLEEHRHSFGPVRQVLSVCVSEK